MLQDGNNGVVITKKPSTPTPIPKPKPRTLVQQNNVANTQNDENVWTNGGSKTKEKPIIQRRTVITTEI